MWSARHSFSCTLPPQRLSEDNLIASLSCCTSAGRVGGLHVLLSYFRDYERPQDAAVLFAEDAVRSAVARELMRWKSDEVFHVLLDAAKQRATEGWFSRWVNSIDPRAFHCCSRFWKTICAEIRPWKACGRFPMPPDNTPFLRFAGSSICKLDRPSALVRRRCGTSTSGSIRRCFGRLGRPAHDFMGRRPRHGDCRCTTRFHGCAGIGLAANRGCTTESRRQTQLGSGGGCLAIAGRTP